MTDNQQITLDCTNPAEIRLRFPEDFSHREIDRLYDEIRPLIWKAIDSDSDVYPSMSSLDKFIRVNETSSVSAKKYHQFGLIILSVLFTTISTNTF